MRILIAEDDVTSRNVLTALLRKFGHDPVVTESGIEAWEALQHPDAPKLVILDWIMPGLDGIEVIRRVRADQLREQPHIIVLTGKKEKTDIIEGLEAGADDYLGKPFHSGELQARINVGCRLIEMRDQMLAQMESLQQAAEQIQALHGILPICTYCKKIRNDQGYWDRVETYISRHTEALFSHGICPKCAAEIFPELQIKDAPGA